MIRVHLAKTAGAAKKIINDNPGLDWVTVETEYGDTAVHGDVSLNHHGDLQHRDAPALAYKLKLEKRYDNFIVSHIDLDVLFGILWTAGWLRRTTITEGLSNLVALADTNGFHTIKSLVDTLPTDTKHRYYAIGYLVNSWVINDNGQHSKDISKEIHKLVLRIKDIIISGATKEQIALYEQWFQEQDTAAKEHLNEISEIGHDKKMFIFRAPFSLTTAYNIGDITAEVIVQYNEQSKSITLSCFDEKVAEKYFGECGVLCPIQKYFGDDAGGKKSIAGTSRSHDIQPEMLDGFIKFLHREYFNTPGIVPVDIPKEVKPIIEVSHEEIKNINSSFDL